MSGLSVRNKVEVHVVPELGQSAKSRSLHQLRLLNDE